MTWLQKGDRAEQRVTSVGNGRPAVVSRADGSYTFALVADSNDGVVFSLLEGTAAPQLVVESAP